MAETAVEPDRAWSLRDGVRAIAPLTPAAFAFGLSFGVLARAAGMGTVAPIVMSATTFAGSAQFAAASVLDQGGGAAAAVVAAVLLNARYGPMSIAAAPEFRGPWWRRFLGSQLIVDESWAFAARGVRFDLGVLFGAGLALYPCWVGGTAVGAIAGDLLGDPNRLGLDAAFPALFLALLVPLLRTRLELTAALAGGAIALVLLPFAAPGVPIIAASAACLLGWRR
jgi:4-azaleucine resistance transporter AzlC